MTPRRRNVWATAALVAVLAAAGCAHKNEAGAGQAPTSRTAEDTGHGGWSPFGGGGDRAQRRREQQSIGVNSLLWRAALDTIGFMPITLTDSFGGEILTDWYADPRTPNERFKMQVFILDTRLRADAVKVSVFKQVQGPNGWVDAAVNADTATQIEDAILAKARELRLATLNEK